MDKLHFTSDYMEGAHPKVLERLIKTNLVKSSGYGTDDFSESARTKIRAACDAPNAEVYFLSGGTQTNAMIIKNLLQPYQGVIAAQTGHIAGHEAGAIEHGGHKVLCAPEHNGKLTASAVNAIMKGYLNDDNHDHMVMPGMVYISQPTESGTLYSLEELKEISQICRENKLYLYVDGARLAYGLACSKNDVSLQDMAKLCDVFYIGGTKCGTLLGEAVVIPNAGLIPHFFTRMKQHGALLAKGRILGVQFDALFTDGLYFNIGQSAVKYADDIRLKLQQKGLKLCFDSPTNQVFVLLPDTMRIKLEQYVNVSFWEKPDDAHTIIRLATSWATTQEDVNQLLEIIESI